jgi:N-acetylmuramoyl-L-alanine amidase
MTKTRNIVLLVFGLALGIGCFAHCQASPSVGDSVVSEKAPASRAADKPLLGRTILIDPGHGGTDPGALRSGIEEKNITLAVSLRLRDRLTALGAAVHLTRDVDEPVALTARLQDSNTMCPDLFLSIHVNAVGDTHITGIETYYYDGRGQLLARMVLDTLSQELHQTAKWSHARDLKVLVGNRAPA